MPSCDGRDALPRDARQDVRWITSGAAPLIVYTFRRVRRQHVHRRLPHMRRQTRRSAATIGGGTADMTVGRAAVPRIERQRVPTRTVARERVRDLRLKNLEAQKLSRLRTMEQIQ